MRASRAVIFASFASFTILWLLLPAFADAAPFPGTRAFCESLEQIADPRLSRCTERDRAAPGVATALEAQARGRQQCLEMLNSALSLSRIKIDAAAAERCAAANAAYAQDPVRSRDKLLAVRAACDAAIIGLKNRGAACDSALECVAGLTCVGLEGAPPGTCQEPLRAGRTCTVDTINASNVAGILSDARPVCGPHAHCASSSLDSRCAKNLGERAKCKGQDLGECGPGLRCGAGTCVAATLGSTGSACAHGKDCAAGYTCAKNHCTVAAAAGAVCMKDDDCRGACSGGKCISRCGSG